MIFSEGEPGVEDKKRYGRIRAGPRDVVAGGALKAKVLNRAAKAARGYERGDQFFIRGVRGPPPENFSKSMYLRTHFKPF